MKLLNISTLIFTLLFLAACSNTEQVMDSFAEAEEAYNQDPTEENVTNLLNAYNVFLAQNHSDMKKVPVVLKKAYEVSKEHRPSATGRYLTGLIRETSPGEQVFPEYLYELGTQLRVQGKNDASTVILSSLATNFPDFEKSTEIKSVVQEVKPMDIVNRLAASRMENPDQFGINRVATTAYVDACEAYALANPTSNKSPELLFDAAEMAKLLRTNNKALGLYDWMIQKYPDYSKTPTALFIKAFMLENELNNLELAKAAYEEFLEKYPDNDFADDARFSLENLGRSPEEVLKMIEQQNTN